MLWLFNSFIYRPVIRLGFAGKYYWQPIGHARIVFLSAAVQVAYTWKCFGDMSVVCWGCSFATWKKLQYIFLWGVPLSLFILNNSIKFQHRFQLWLVWPPWLTKESICIFVLCLYDLFDLSICSQKIFYQVDISCWSFLCLGIWVRQWCSWQSISKLNLVLNALRIMLDSGIFVK